jgi:predicted RNase H-like nuclease (RuvC/YqgF family)
VGRYDENDALIESIVEAYEKEIESLTKEASSVITTMKKSVEKMRENMNIDEKINTINKRFDDSLSSIGQISFKLSAGTQYLWH